MIHSAYKLITKKMTIKEKIGQLLMLDFRHWFVNYKKCDVIEPIDSIAQILMQYHIGGVILFRENLITSDQIIKLIHFFHELSLNAPLFISVDQEGGYVTRLQQGTEMPGNMAIGATRSTEFAQITGMIHGNELANLGINMNFSPVVDINNNQFNPIINVRAYSDDPQLVTKLANAYIDGLHKKHIIPVVKHFPGHGNVNMDSHFDLPSININKSDWENMELIPFKQLMNKTEAIMTAHVVIPTLDNKMIKTKDGKKVGTPATLSNPILTDLLRNQLQYKGLIITDAMNMGAISAHFDELWAIKQAILAGNDIILMPLSIQKTEDEFKLKQLYDYLIDECSKNDALKQRIDESAERIIQLKLNKLSANHSNSPNRPKTAIPTEFNKQIEDLISAKSITLIKNEGHLLPINIEDLKNITVISDEHERNNIIKKQFIELQKELDITLNISDAVVKLSDGNLNITAIKDKLTSTDLIILVTYNLSLNPINAQKIIDYANVNKIPLVVISSRNPYDIAYLTHVTANIAIYGITGFDVTNYARNRLETNIKNGIWTLFSYQNMPLNQPEGKLPVNIKHPNTDEILFPFGHGLHF